MRSKRNRSLWQFSGVKVWSGNFSFTDSFVEDQEAHPKNPQIPPVASRKKTVTCKNDEIFWYSGVGPGYRSSKKNSKLRNFILLAVLCDLSGMVIQVILLNGWNHDLQLGDKKVTNWITWLLYWYHSLHDVQISPVPSKKTFEKGSWERLFGVKKS